MVRGLNFNICLLRILIFRGVKLVNLLRLKTINMHSRGNMHFLLISPKHFQMLKAKWKSSPDFLSFWKLGGGACVNIDPYWWDTLWQRTHCMQYLFMKLSYHNNNCHLALWTFRMKLCRALTTKLKLLRVVLVGTLMYKKNWLKPFWKMSKVYCVKNNPGFITGI